MCVGGEEHSYVEHAEGICTLHQATLDVILPCVPLPRVIDLMETNRRAGQQERVDWLRNWESVWKVGGSYFIPSWDGEQASMAVGVANIRA